MSNDIQVKREHKATITIGNKTFRLGDLRLATAGLHNDSRVTISTIPGSMQRDPDAAGYVFVIDLATAEG